MTYKEWAESFTIFDKYADPEKPYAVVNAEHDELYAGPAPEDTSCEDKERLAQLGWMESEEYDCFTHFT